MGNSRFKVPSQLWFDRQSQVLYVGEERSAVRAIDTGAASMTVQTISGHGSSGDDDGDAQNPKYKNPVGIVGIRSPGATNPVLYVADRDNNKIRKLTKTAQGGANWQTTTLVGAAGDAPLIDGIFNAATFDKPHQLAAYRSGSGGSTT